MFSSFILALAIVFYGILPVVVLLTACYFIAYFIGCIPDIWSYIKAWWKVRFGL